jgi:hypothetical protein
MHMHHSQLLFVDRQGQLQPLRSYYNKDQHCGHFSANFKDTADALGLDTTSHRPVNAVTKNMRLKLLKETDVNTPFDMCTTQCTRRRTAKMHATQRNAQRNSAGRTAQLCWNQARCNVDAFKMPPCLASCCSAKQEHKMCTHHRCVQHGNRSAGSEAFTTQQHEEGVCRALCSTP